MRIVVLQDRLRSGGTERQAIALTRAFLAAGHQAELIAFRPGGKLWAGAADIGPRALQPFDLGWDWFAPGLLGAVREREPEVLMAMGRMANCHLWRAARALRPGARTVATFRTGKSLPAWFRRSLRAADAIVANSHEAASNLSRRYGLPPAKITPIYNGLVFGEPWKRRPAASAGEPSGKTPLPADRSSALERSFVFLCVAMFRREKNQAGLIRLMSGLAGTPGWELWLAGEGPCRKRCERLAARLGLRERVKFLGYQGDPGALYAAADAAVLASTSEGLSNFLIEAQAHGLPAIACNAQGVAECFLPGETGWVIAPGDAGGFRAAALRLMAMGEPERGRIGARASAFARERFDPASQIAAYLELYRRLLGSDAG